MRWRAPLLLGAVLLLAGCAASAVSSGVQTPPSAEELAFVADKPDPLKGMYAKVIAEGKRNLVLNHMQVGLAAMEMGEYGLAEESFEHALAHIESVYANNPEAAKARSLWHEEGAKDFKGEPYERAMAYYYRGLLYLRQGDYENARACFKGGMLQDAFTEEEQYQCDFALLLFLEGWASQRLGDQVLADEAYAELKKLRPDFIPPDAGHSALALVETGTSPRKVSDGVGHAELKYRRGKDIKEERVLLRLSQEDRVAYPMEDIFFQARTRGGRPIDKILEGKAVFLQTGLSAGTALTEVASGVILASTLLEHNSAATANIGAAIGAVGGVATLVAINAKPHADTRYWKNLPDLVHVETFPAAAAESLAVRFATADGTPLDAGPKELAPMRDDKGGVLYWGRSRSSINN